MKGKKNASPQQPNLFDELELPEGWTLTKIRDLVTINYGKGLKDADRAGGNVSVYGSNGIVGAHNKALTDGPSIIIGRKGSIGEVHYSANPSWPIDTTYYIDKFEGIDQTFLVFALKSLNLSNLDTSTAIPGLNRNDIYDQEIPLPPLAEQQRIVARVEALLTHVNAARDRLNRVPLIMKKFRQAVLAAACSGRLTEGWREENSQIPSSTEALDTFFRYVRDDSSLKIIQKRTKNTETIPDFEWSFEIPESWCWAKLEKLAALEKNSITDGPFGSNLKTEHYSQSGPRVIRLQNIGDGSFIDIKTHISQSHFDTLHKHEIFPGDIAIGLLGDPIPRSCIIPAGIGPAIVKADCTRFKPNPELALTEFLSYAINEPELRSQATESVHGVARPRLNLTQIKNFTIPLPPLAEQHEIVCRVGTLFEHVNAIEREVLVAGQRCERLTQAVLGKAFRGELVENKNETN